MVCRRQEQHRFEAKCKLQFEDGNHDEEAGMTVFMHDHYYYSICVQFRVKKRRFVVHKEVGDISINVVDIPAPDGDIVFVIRGDEDNYCLGIEQQGYFVELARGMTKCLASEFTGGFSGVMIGMYATCNNRSSKAFADYDWFEYRNL